jgi:hypothetical protein
VGSSFKRHPLFKYANCQQRLCRHLARLFPRLGQPKLVRQHVGRARLTGRPAPNPALAPRDAWSPSPPAAAPPPLPPAAAGPGKGQPAQPAMPCPRPPAPATQPLGSAGGAGAAGAGAGWAGADGGPRRSGAETPLSPAALRYAEEIRRQVRREKPRRRDGEARRRGRMRVSAVFVAEV